VVLLCLMFSKFVYTSSMSSFYTFYLIDTFKLSNDEAQINLFIYLAAFAAGTLLGGPIGDKIGRKAVIWFSVLGALPFTLALPYANHFWTVALSIPIGFILASAFSAMLVYAQELMPGRVGMVSGLFFGLAFGIAGGGCCGARLRWRTRRRSSSSTTSARSCPRSVFSPCSCRTLKELNRQAAAA
jgi:MFS transporter, FSR family, fosmidomycin resistance protein